MKSLKLVRGAMVALAALGVAFPQLPAIAAGSKTAAKPIVKTVAPNTVLDIGLTQGGTFAGRVVDHTGAGMEGAEVVIKQGKAEVSRTITDKQGSFVASNLKGGVYTVASGATEGTYRAWSEKTAPPSAKGQALLVLGQNGARGQGGMFDEGGLVILVGATLIVSTIAAIYAVKAHEDIHELGLRLPCSP
jgi:carboxypeptidase family protein